MRSAVFFEGAEAGRKLSRFWILLVLAAVIAIGPAITPAVAIVAVIVLIALGMVGASVGGASMLRGAVRVTFWGILAMAVTAGVGALFGTVAA